MPFGITPRSRTFGFPCVHVLGMALVALLALPAARAGANASGCELLGFPSDDGAAPAAAPACAVPAAMLYAGGEAPLPLPNPPNPPNPPSMSPPPPDAHAPYAPRFLYGPHTARMDTVIVVRPGTKFVLSNFGGSIAIRTWPKDAVRVQAAYSRRARVSVRLQDGTLRVSSDSREGPPSPVGYMLTMPAWLPVSLSGVYNDVSVDGLQKGVSVETVRGDIVVRRAAGVIALRSVEGAVDVVDTRGSIAASSVNEAVRIAQSAGSVAAEAVNGDIHLLDLNSKDVEATTVNGGVIYDGRILDGGMYRFTTHSGDIALGLAESANATVSVSTFSGDFASAFAIQPRRAGRGRRFNFVLGNGKAQVDLESFQGSIELLRPGGAELRARVAEAWREHERDFARAFGKEWRWELKGDKADPDPDPNPLPDEDDGGN